MNAKVGFGRESLVGSWETEHGCADTIDVRAFVLINPDGSVSALLTADVDNIWPDVCADLRRKIAGELNTVPENVCIFSTQNHSVAMKGPDFFDPDLWEQAFVRAAAKAYGSAVPARMCYVKTTPQPPEVANRRKRFLDAGSFSFWYGFDVTEQREADCSALLRTACLGLASGPEKTIRCTYPEAEDLKLPEGTDIPDIPDKLLLDGPADTLIQALFFCSESGEPVGSLSRWAAHPCTANIKGDMHTGDYPAYLRNRLEEKFGGSAVFFTGPCGNQTPLIPAKSRELAREIGYRTADLLLECLDGGKWEDITRADPFSADVELPIRSDYPETPEQAGQDLAAAREKLKELRSSGGTLKELKAVSEEIERLRYAAEETHYTFVGMHVRGRPPGSRFHPLFALRINDTIIAGLPGEPFGDYSIRLRRQFPGLDLIVVDECNGYLGYFPTKEEYPLGGYESAFALFAPEAEDILIEGVSNIIDRLAD